MVSSTRRFILNLALRFSLCLSVLLALRSSRLGERAGLCAFRVCVLFFYFILFYFFLFILFYFILFFCFPRDGLCLLPFPLGVKDCACCTPWTFLCDFVLRGLLVLLLNRIYTYIYPNINLY